MKRLWWALAGFGDMYITSIPPCAADEGVASMLHFVLEPFLLRRVKSEVGLNEYVAQGLNLN